jgi:hypothetical protein
LGFIHYHEKKELDTSKEPAEPDAVGIWDEETYYMRQRLNFPREFIRDMKERRKIIKQIAFS